MTARHGHRTSRCWWSRPMGVKAVSASKAGAASSANDASGRPAKSRSRRTRQASAAADARRNGVNRRSDVTSPASPARYAAGEQRAELSQARQEVGAPRGVVHAGGGRRGEGFEQGAADLQPVRRVEEDEVGRAERAARRRRREQPPRRTLGARQQRPEQRRIRAHERQRLGRDIERGAQHERGRAQRRGSARAAPPEGQRQRGAAGQDEEGLRREVAEAGVEQVGGLEREQQRRGESAGGAQRGQRERVQRGQAGGADEQGREPQDRHRHAAELEGERRGVDVERGEVVRMTGAQRVAPPPQLDAPVGRRARQVEGDLHAQHGVGGLVRPQARQVERARAGEEE